MCAIILSSKRKGSCIKQSVSVVVLLIRGDCVGGFADSILILFMETYLREEVRFFFLSRKHTKFLNLQKNY